MADITDPRLFSFRQAILINYIASWIKSEEKVRPVDIRITRLDNIDGLLAIDSQYKHPQTRRWRTTATIYR